jgi:hypothetical protein
LRLEPAQDVPSAGRHRRADIHPAFLTLGCALICYNDLT